MYENSNFQIYGDIKFQILHNRHIRNFEFSKFENSKSGNFTFPKSQNIEISKDEII